MIRWKSGVRSVRRAGETLGNPCKSSALLRNLITSLFFDENVMGIGYGGESLKFI